MLPKSDMTADYGIGALRVHVDLDEVQGLLKDRVVHRRIADDFLETAALSVAERIAELARQRLAVGGKENVGASGASAKNIFVRKSGEHDAVIYEGPIGANIFIREGRSKGAKKPPAKAIVDWMVTKPGFVFKRPSDQRGTWRMTKYGGPRANLRSRPSRPFKRDLKQAAGIIANKIAERGMSHFTSKYPPGTPRYDYYGEIMSRTPGAEHFHRMVRKGYSTWFRLYVNFIRRGFISKIGKREFGG